MTDTPTPITLADGWILTTLYRAELQGHGQWTHADNLRANDHTGEIDIEPGSVWRDHNNLGGWKYNAIVIWRPTPPRTVTIELPESEVRRVADTCWWGATGDDVVHEACRDAIARLDGDT